MIKCVIEINEIPGKGYRIKMEPDQSNATQKEKHVASCIDHALKPVFEYLMAQGDRGEMIESKDMDTVRRLAEKRIKDFDS